MPNGNEGANVEFSTEELEALFGKTTQQETPPATPNEQTPPAGQQSDKHEDVTTTKAFAQRLKESTQKAVAEERERIAASLGYTSYAEMEKAKENKLLEDKGLDPEQVSPIVDEIVKRKLENDPRIKELEQFKQKQVEEFAQRELNDISTLTGVKYTSLDQLPKDVIEDWRKTGSLKKSYINLHGEELILKAQHAAQRGDTSHLQNPANTAPTPTDMRPLTDREKSIWKLFNRGITDEELNQKTTKI